MASRDRSNDSPSYRERLDPSLAMGDSVAEFIKLANHPLVEFLGLPTDLIERLRKLGADYEISTNLEPVAAALAPLGWCVFARADSTVYRTAAELAITGCISEADDVLVDHWSVDGRLRVEDLRLRQLYTREDPPRLDIATARHDLLQRAFALHQSESYEGSIPIVLAQIDGICADVTRKPAKQRFAKKFFQQRNDHLQDDCTVAGHRLGLAALTKVFCADAKDTTLGSELSRHGILHGRVLGYGTKTNSTKAFVALHAFLEWAYVEVWPRQEEHSICE